MLGWLNGNEDDILANAALWDQRFALHWVQKYIHLFGGDPDRVTAFGGSAGSGSIMHQITAFGGTQEKAPFKQALLQSPAVVAPTNVPAIWNDTLAAASRLSGMSIASAKDLRALNSSVLIRTNQAVVFNSVPGLFTFGPTIDGGFVPDYASVLLLEDKFDHGVKVSHKIRHVEKRLLTVADPADDWPQPE